ncbi:hypothetical protein GIB67_015497 [Kingdonia uniflora]|uniref:Uncharacterized protein n=1 Tax=Kingdonia uniflora TaxID=39325 RepID=A0A7J7LAJ1_9MAGN|nr:hypothetical protein GIB67_015497 [Kingdonia uniflora]
MISPQPQLPAKPPANTRERYVACYFDIPYNQSGCGRGYGQRNKAKLQEFLGRKNLDRHLDADEAIVLGASLHAANLSDGIKLNRKLGMIDGSSYGFVVQLDGPDLVNDETSKDLLVQRMKKLPSKMFRSLKHNKDFKVSLSYETGGALPPGVSSYKFAQYAVSGLTDASDKYSSRNLSSPIKANLHYTLSRNGILSLDRAEAVIEISEWVDVPKKNLTAQNATTATPTISVDVGSGNISEGSTEKSGNDNMNSGSRINNTSDSNLGEQSILDVGTEKKLKKRTFRVPLKIVEKTVGPGKSLSEESLSEAKIRLAALDKKDADRRRTAELKNNLEGYIYATKEKIESSEEIGKVSTDQERRSFVEKLEEVQEWLYTDGEDASATEFQERLDLLKIIGDPIFFRLDELSARPEALEQARRYFGEIQQIVTSWEKNKPWLPKGKIDEVLSGTDKIRNWLKEKEAEQKKISAFSTPAFTSEEVYGKVFDLQDKVASINKIPKPKPKVEKLIKNETESDGEKANKNSSEESSEKEPAPEESSQKEPAAEDRVESSSEKEDAKTENHDEL